MSRSVALRLLLVGFLIPCLFAACNRDPNVRKQKFLESANRYRDKGKLREAAIQYSNAIQIDPRFAEAHFQLGETYLQLKDFNRAYSELSRAADLAPDNYQAHADLANLLVAARNPDGSANQDYLKQARTHLDLLKEKQPNNGDTHQAWANYYSAQNDLGSALQEMQKAIAAEPTRPGYYLSLAFLQMRANLPKDAEASFKKGAELGPKDLNAQLALGGYYQSQGRLAEAEQQFKHAIEVDAKDPTPRADFVRLLMAEGKKSDAEAFLRQTKADFPDTSEGYRMLGDFYFANGELDKATNEYSVLYSQHPKDPQVKKNYIQLLILKDRLDEASKFTAEVLKANPRDADALVYRGEILLRQNDANGAVDALQQAIKQDSNNAVAHYQLGLAYAMQHNPAQSEAELREAVNERPDLTDAQRALAGSEMSRGDFDALTQTAQQIIAAAPNAPDGYLMRALAEMNSKKFTQAEQDMRKASQVAPASPAPYVQLGNLYQVQKQYPQAVKFYQQALDKDSTSSDALQGIMNTYIAQKQIDQAIAAARSYVAKSPNTSNFYDLLGTALFQKKDYNGAGDAFQKAVDLDKNNSDALLKLAQVQAAQGSPAKALAIYQQSIKDHPRDISFYLLAGMMYESQGSYDQAKSMYQQVLNIQPDNPLASNNLAYVMLQQGGNVDVALAMAQTARRGAPDLPQAADTLGWAYFQKGVYQSAIDMFQESLRLSERRGAADDPTVHYHLGLAYQKANQPALARQQLERSLKINPNNGDAKKALSDLRG
ncbi:MAG TPA: tetratricopeptide repeat protein [Candidatus Binatia bacterium]|nr:tetratricopeptide repeat protein [Candidatus Binatia bacterium]